MDQNIIIEEGLEKCAKSLYNLMQDKNSIFKGIPFENLTGTVSRATQGESYIRAAIVSHLNIILVEKINPTIFSYVFKIDRTSVYYIFKSHTSRMRKRQYSLYQSYYNNMPEKSECMELEGFKQMKPFIEPIIFETPPYMPTKKHAGHKFIILDEHREKAREILKIMAEKLNTTPENIASSDRKKELIVARTAFTIKFLIIYPKTSFKALGILLGGRDHSTIHRLLCVYREMFDPKNKSSFVTWYRTLVISLIETT